MNTKVRKKSNIVLIGFMGTGKTSIGRKTAKVLGKGFVDTDILIEETLSMTIPDIFKHFGEPFFRQQELKAAIKVSDYKNHVIATGGGIVTVPKSLNMLRKNAIIIWLKLPFNTIIKRIIKDAGRPLAFDKNDNQLKALFDSRSRLYAEHCDEIVELEGRSIEQAAMQIVEIYEKTAV